MSDETKTPEPTKDELIAKIKAAEDVELKKCQTELSALLTKYNAELVPATIIQDGRIATQLGLRIKKAE